ncbi:hypothetical protein [Streptomyces cucumeris]|uniref:hypothetical protein n=1 Tax=Streptomyces cucumeris TaxID=2962890 RepID=UPI003D70334C
MPLDKLSAHKNTRILRWANQIEAQVGPLWQFIPTPGTPDVLAARRCERAAVRSEKGIRWGGRLLAQAA